MSMTIIALSIAITFAACLIRFAVWVMFPRKDEIDPFSEPHGDVVNDPRGSV